MTEEQAAQVKRNFEEAKKLFAGSSIDAMTQQFSGLFKVLFLTTQMSIDSATKVAELEARIERLESGVA